MPVVQAWLHGVEVISARAAYEQHGLFAPTTWKCRAFAEQMKLLNAHDSAAGCRSIISIGDSIHEREALLWATSGLADCWAKALKLVERPSLDRLIEQHELLSSCLDQVVDHDGPMDYEIEEERA
jgi:hypothetical protein